MILGAVQGNIVYVEEGMNLTEEIKQFIKEK